MAAARMKGVSARPESPSEDSMPLHCPPARLASLMLLAVTVGCAPAAAPSRPAAPATQAGGAHADHGHAHEHEPPNSFAEGVAALRDRALELGAKLAAKADGDADAAVHEIGHLLEAVRGMATKEGLAEAASKGLDELEECFGKVDEAFHSGDEKADPKKVLESVQERLEAAFKLLGEVK
jgi:hypothetical protein